jgi:uncharacterized membrane protein
MTSKSIFSVAGIITFLAGIGVLLLPGAFMAPFGMSLDPAGVHMARLNGATALALGALFWLAREWTDWKTVRVVAICGLLSYVVAMIIAAASTLSGVMDAFGWGNVALDGLFSLGFGYLLFIRKAAE